MKNTFIGKRLSLIAAVIGVLAAILGVIQMIDRIRVVDILLLFFGGFGAGAGLIKAIMDYRMKKTDTDLTTH
ncbi:MAG: hypothetical protein NTX44_14150 [Ignavibacteriales bacterium]|nr:hypothetical protein [Ignavibacteriales bacterium]